MKECCEATPGQKPHDLMVDRIQNIITRVDNILQATFILIEA